jgi:D-lyxose ketol-isomerase
MKLTEANLLRRKSVAMLKRAGIAVTKDEATSIEVADLGLNDIMNIGLQLITYHNDDRYCAKELILLPFQTCPEHRHPPMDERNIGKQETFRCRWGTVYLYVAGKPTPKIKARVPEAGRTVHDSSQHAPLVPGRQGGRHRFGVLIKEH